jgi:hypothetical protein
MDFMVLKRMIGEVQKVQKHKTHVMSTKSI